MAGTVNEGGEAWPTSASPSGTGQREESTGAGPVAASLEGEPAAKVKRTRSEARKERWRRIHAGEIPNPDKRPVPTADEATKERLNPLLNMAEKEQGKLFAWMRDCPYDDHIQQMLRDHGMPEATSLELNDFFAFAAERIWEHRLLRAAQEANALVRLAEKSPVRFSAGILAALGQEAFRQIANGQVDPDAMGKLTTLFLKARSDERADQMQQLRREKLRRDLQGQIDHALEKLAEEIERHPEARAAFDALKKELAKSMEEEGEF